LFSAALMSFSTSLVTVPHSASVGVSLYGTSYNGVAAVDVRTASTLSLKTAANSSLSRVSISVGCRTSPRTLWNVRHSSCRLYLPQSHSASNCCSFLRTTDASPSASPLRLACLRQIDSAGNAAPQLLLDVEPLGSLRHTTGSSECLCDVPSRSDSDGRAGLSARRCRAWQGRPQTSR